jgi:D-methionine transport system ATP-binding protein
MRITLKNLKRSYGQLHAVNDVSLSIPSNTIFGIIGKSGAGKSTLVRLVSLLEKPDSEKYTMTTNVSIICQKTNS